MRPIVTCEKPAFQRLIRGLSGLADNISLPDRQVIVKELQLKYVSYISMLTELISKHNFICTTADIWSCNNKSYLGMTCHFINETTYDRSSYVLGCRRIKGSHTYSNIAEIINEITQTYEIENSKISHTVTDNASNFGKAFKTFSSQSSTSNQSNSTDNYTRGNNWFCSDDSSNDNSDDEIEVEIITTHSILGSENNIEEQDISLPEHMTCTAHSLNLIATSDISKITDLSYNKISKVTFKKMYSFWNLLSRSTVASDKVYEICGCKFPVPVITRWNSLFYAIKKVVAFKDKLISTFDELKLSKLKLCEWLFLEEYCAVMEPLAQSLDKLQGEKTCFLGYVVPTIIALRLKLIQLTNLVYCRPLSLLIIESLEKRFVFIFDLENTKSKAYIMSTISHPKFKLHCIPMRFMSFCKKIFISECNLINLSSNGLDLNLEQSENDDDFYNILNESSYSQSSISSSTNLGSIQAFSYFDSKEKELNMLNSYPIIKKIFLKYNTTLPSSAPVERLFSCGSQILTPRRNKLSDKKFEMLLCCRCLLLNNYK